MVTRTPRLLVKTRPLPPGTPVKLAATSPAFVLKPLFPEQHAAAAMGAAPAAQWHVAEVAEPAGEADAWDLCHRMHREGFGIAGAGEVEFAEPDVVQQWPVESKEQLTQQAFAAATGQTCNSPAPPLGEPYKSPNPYDWRWFQGDHFTGLASARSEVQDPADRLTIAHLDTGYRNNHSVLPRFLDRNRQRNFVDKDRVNDASDPGTEGLNFGHGTGTLSLLAGSNFDGGPFGVPSGIVGGAPFANILPIRVANSVVLFANSAIAQALRYVIDERVDVLSMSMGGVPSQVWVELVNEAYESGITLVTAAGNNFGPGKVRVPRFIVYPARFRRVLAACGVMSDGSAYADFNDFTRMAGSYGPDSKMDTAMAAFTPNVPWAVYECPALVRFDGTGTSSATPQIAAAAACWLQKNRGNLHYSQAWMRVEAVRHALYTSASNTNREHFGRGTVRAGVAMGQAPAAEAQLRMEERDSVAVPILEPIFHDLFGVTGAPAQEQMLHVEAAQILARSGELQRILADAGADPDRPLEETPEPVRRQFIQALADDSSASKTLKAALAHAGAIGLPRHSAPASADTPSSAEIFSVPPPLHRKIRVYAFDPIMGTRVDTESLNQTTLKIEWEPDLQPGPVGEYVEVVDVDPASGAAYAPVDLNHPHLLASNGLDPAEGVPQFHQQMVYAVAMSHG